ncbi:hypothetical protein BDZ89DRAFT_1034303 [Hymenopellis radicata]|nr:hypothetical protein BDZ89DRAFT_1034303 [Hymenopellis radicata]
MPSFSSILSYAALGLAAFASVQAAPMVEKGLVLRDVEARCGCKTLPTIVADLTVDLTVTLAPLVFGTADNITVEIVTPIIHEAEAIISVAIADVKVLVGETLEVVLTSATGVLGLVDIAALLCTLITLIFNAVHIVLSVVVSAELDLIAPLLCELFTLRTLVAELLQLVLSLVSGLLAVLLPLILSVIVSVIVKLNLGSVFVFLGVQLNAVL